MKTLLVGMGNPILSDDAVGVRLASDFRSRAGDGFAAMGLDVVEECSVGGMNLIDLFRGYDQVIVLDSISTSGGVPGDWHRLSASSLAETLHLTNIHDVNLATALELGRRVGVPLPASERIHIFAVEIQDDRTFSEEMTEDLTRAYPNLAAEIFPEIEEILRIPDRDPRGTPSYPETR